MEWRTDIEAAPKDGTPVLVWGGQVDNWSDEHELCKTLDRPVVAWLEKHPRLQAANWRYCAYDGYMYGEYEGPTHWMPLPPLPEETV